MKKQKALVRLARPHHYIKNGFVFVPLFFAHGISDPAALLTVLVAFAGFCFAAGAVYVFNDLVDVNADAVHPLRRHRPLAAAEITPPDARIFMAVLLASAAGCCFYLYNSTYCLALVAYVLLNIIYTMGLKRILIIGAISVAFGFLLRVIAGAVVIQVPVSPWLTGLTFLLALMLAFSKRRCDIYVFESEGLPHPAGVYQRKVLDIMIVMLAAASVVGYSLYTRAPSVTVEHGAPDLYLTIPWVVAGIARYLRVLYYRRACCYPVETLVHDRLLQMIVAGWIISLSWMLYGNGRGGI